MGFLFATPSDVTLIVIEEPSENDERKKKTALFHVDRSNLIASSPYFERMFSSRWEGSGSHNPTLRGDTIKSMEVMLGVIHGVDTKPETVSVADVWYTIKACNKYQLDPKRLMGWFAQWIKWIDQETPARWENWAFNRQLLFPCYFFDHAEAFQHVSKRLVYNTPGHITEMAPTDSPSFEPMHMPPIVMQQLNAARGRLRTILQRSLFEDANVAIDYAHCNCAARNIFFYMRELHRIGVRPLDSEIHKNCVRDILDRLENFDDDTITNSHPASAQICNACSRSWKRVVEYTRRQVKSYFDGLCLDCMQNHPDENSEYWALDTPRYMYDNTCRIRHGEPTWYFSFMGRRDRNPYRTQS
ncbi:BTB/POZ fold [Penicillium camemberti]|uniref:BTB/POZ fold n=1 Tax=Penicillium camemberti (strain FM 013) TaxID=1429867 RepID=A0A0G4NSU5_PENC3|nr:BTB/POZ fold [Penicillium camemberti]